MRSGSFRNDMTVGTRATRAEQRQRAGSRYHNTSYITCTLSLLLEGGHQSITGTGSKRSVSLTLNKTGSQTDGHLP